MPLNIDPLARIVAGIDPGLKGALAVLNDAGDCVSIHMPVVDGLVDGGAVARFLDEHGVRTAVIEHQGAMPGEWTDRKTGKLRKQGVASAFAIGRTYGQLLGILQASLISYHIVTPSQWKKALKLSRDKEASRRRAIQLLPSAGEQFSLKKDEARAEAALIAWWFMHSQQGGKENRRPLSLASGG